MKLVSFNVLSKDDENDIWKGPILRISHMHDSIYMFFDSVKTVDVFIDVLEKLKKELKEL